MKVREVRVVSTGLGGWSPQARIVEVPDNTKLEPGMQKVAEDTPVHDWQPVFGEESE